MTWHKHLSLLTLGFLLVAGVAQAAEVTLLNVSYDPTRELYAAYDPLFIKYWKAKTGEEVTITESHGGSGTQARSVIEGLKADVVTLALAYDIDKIAERGLIAKDWQGKLPNDSAPYTSTIVFLVRKGNPKHIRDWDDLIKDDVRVITPNPKTSGGARWNYMAAWGYAMKKNNNDEEAAKAYIASLFHHVPLLDTGARGAATTFVRREMGDVLLAWENEALLISKHMDTEHFEVVYPSISILAEPPVTVVDKNAERKGTLTEAKAFLEYLYSKEAQEVIAQNYYRPSDSEVAKKYAGQFPALTLVKIGDFGGWKEVQKKQFGENGIFDQIYMK